MSRQGLKMWQNTIAFYAAMDPPPSHFRPTTREECADDEFDE